MNKRSSRDRTGKCTNWHCIKALFDHRHTFNVMFKSKVVVWRGRRECHHIFFPVMRPKTQLFVPSTVKQLLPRAPMAASYYWCPDVCHNYPRFLPLLFCLLFTLLAAGCWVMAVVLTHEKSASRRKRAIGLNSKLLQDHIFSQYRPLHWELRKRVRARHQVSFLQCCKVFLC